MKKSTLFSFVQGVMWASINTMIGLKIDDWKWWANLLIGSVILTIIYDKCKDK